MLREGQVFAGQAVFQSFAKSEWSHQGKAFGELLHCVFSFGDDF